MVKTALRYPILVLFAWQALSSPAAEESLSKEELSQHLRYLASDELMGRAAGTPGADQAARYIAEQFQKAGLKTLPGFDNYLQRIPFRHTGRVEAGTLVVGGKTYKQGENLLILEGPALEQTVPAVFSRAAAADLEQLDLKGRLLVAPLEDPSNPGSFRAALRQSRQRRTLLAAKGAVGLAEIYQGPAWDRIAGFLGRERLEAATPESSEVTPLLHVLIRQPEEEAIPWSEGKLPAVAIQVSGRPVETVYSSNVGGWVEGTDPALRDQFVFLTAHYDHLGAGRDLPNATEEDFIFNGARDNGMGVVALIAAAESLAEKPAARSVAFLAVTAEEAGTLGSSYYVEHPAIPLQKTVFVLNTDSGGYNDTGVVTIMGLERTTAQKDLQAACSDFGMEGITDPEPAQGFFNRSDNIHFARRGIPAPTFSPGFRAFDQELMKYYHRPADEADESFDFDYLLRFSQAYARSARRIADDPAQPHWAPGDPFEEAWKELYGK